MQIKEITFEEIDSTSSYIKRNASNLDNFTFVSSLFQTNGRGRMNRIWISKKGENLMFSFIIKDKNLINKFASLSIASATSILEVFKQYDVFLDIKIKWPNDVYVNNKKISGILLESQSNNNELSYLVIGIGINLNCYIPQEINNIATSYYQETKKKINIQEFKEKLYTKLIDTFDKIKNDNNSYLAIANKYNYLYKKTVYAEYKDKIEQVTVLKINDDNSLQVLLNNQIVNVFHGELTFHLNQD